MILITSAAVKVEEGQPLICSGATPQCLWSPLQPVIIIRGLAYTFLYT
jgi:hypothetical protein